MKKKLEDQIVSQKNLPIKIKLSIDEKIKIAEEKKKARELEKLKQAEEKKKAKEEAKVKKAEEKKTKKLKLN